MVNGISWFGACLVAGELLKRSKEGKEDAESYGDKMSRDNFNFRAYSVRKALNNNGGPNSSAVADIQSQWFTDVDSETFEVWLKEAVDSLNANAAAVNVLLPKESVGNLDFASVVASEGCDDDGDDDDDGDPANW